jgi:hypothetical protein
MRPASQCLILARTRNAEERRSVGRAHSTFRPAYRYPVIGEEPGPQLIIHCTGSDRELGEVLGDACGREGGLNRYLAPLVADWRGASLIPRAYPKREADRKSGLPRRFEPPPFALL